MKTKMPLSQYKPKKFITVSISILVISIFTTSSSCALFQRKNLRLTTAVEENLVPEESPWKLIAAPLYIPIGIGAGLLDVFLVHPIAVIPDAGNDTLNVLWTPKGLGYYTQMGAIPFSLLATPPFFALAWSYHWLFEGGRNNRVSKDTLDYQEWKLTIKKSIEKKDLSQFEKIYNNNRQHRNLEIFIQAREVFRNEKIESDLLDSILQYWSENDTARNYILREFKNDKQVSRYVYFLNECKLPDCRKAVLDKVKNTKNPNDLASLVRIYFQIATDEEKEKFLNQLQALE